MRKDDIQVTTLDKERLDPASMYFVKCPKTINGLHIWTGKTYMDLYVHYYPQCVACKIINNTELKKEEKEEEPRPRKPKPQEPIKAY